MRISVVIPSHNADRYLGQAIGSVLEQTLQPHEIIIVDDASDDDSLRVARQFQVRFPDRVKVYAERCFNAPTVRNLGASVATGDSLMFLDSDDFIRPDTLEALARALEGQEQAVAICPWFHVHLRDGRWVEGPPTCNPRRPGQDPLSAYLNGWAHPPVSVLWTREGFEAAGRWDERCGQNQDGDLMMRALLLGVTLVETKAGAAYYRRMPLGDNLATVTGRRYTAYGVSNLIYVARKIAWLAELTGQGQRYRPGIRRSFAAIAGLAAKHGHHELASQARAGVKLYQQPWEALVSYRGENQLRRAYRELRRVHQEIRRHPTSATRSVGSDDAEVRWGAEVAAQVADTDPGVLPPSAPVDRPAASVVVIAIRGTNMLEQTVAGVLEQLADVEVIVVHHPGQVTDALAPRLQDSRVRLLCVTRDEGLNTARNRGLRSVRGEVVALRDADDLEGLDALADQVRHLGQAPDGVGLLAGPGSETTEVRLPTARRANRFTRGSGQVASVPTKITGVVFRRSVIASVGFFDEAAAHDGPTEYWSRVARFFRVEVMRDDVAKRRVPAS